MSSIMYSSDIESESADSNLSCSEKKNLTNLKESNLCPFKLNWVFGLNSTVPIINLTTRNRTLIAYACSHVAVLYDYRSKEMLTLQGHTNDVRTLSTTADGKWLLTADFGKDSTVVIWDTEKCIPICTLFNPHGETGITAAKISPNAKYVITVGNEECQILKFWLWTCGQDVADASIELSSTKRDRVKEISFNNNNSDQFILTLEHHVLFVTWASENLYYNYEVFKTNFFKENERLHVHHPHIRRTQEIGVLNNSLYLSRAHTAITSTSNGFILMWSCPTEKTNLEEKTKNEMQFLKAARLHKCDITQIVCHRDLVVLGTSKGSLYFYDEGLKLLYWCSECNFDSISSISFDHSSELKAPQFLEDTENDVAGNRNWSETKSVDCCEFDNFSTSSESRDGTITKEYTKFESKDDSREIESNFSFKIEYITRNRKTIKKCKSQTDCPGPTDATLEERSFFIERFFVCTKMGKLAWLDIPKLKCRFVSHPSESSVTALDLHSDLNYLVVGNSSGSISLFNHVDHTLMIFKKTPPLPNFVEIFNTETTNYDITHVSNFNTQETLHSVTALKYSPKSDMLICGLENGAMWILHPDTLDPLDEIPFKHSTAAISNIAFSDNSMFMAYLDDGMLVAVFKKSMKTSPLGFWNFLGKYHSHNSPMKEILFEPVIDNSETPRFFSLGEDQYIVEYDLENSGPYPEPGLKISRADQIELNAIPLSMTWYPQDGVERFFVLSNSEYKFRLINKTRRIIQGTFLGPIFGTPVRIMKILTTGEGEEKQSYIIFATDKEIGIQMLPLDGNPYKTVGMIGHHQKIMKMSLSPCNKFLFTFGYNDQCVMKWRINLRSVEVMAGIGGEGVHPYLCLIDGGKNGWLINEMQNLFYYSQILHQGENIPETRVVSDRIPIEQIPNLMRSIGYYPTNEELESIMEEVSHQNCADSGELNFEEFVKLYINYRPAFGVPITQFKDAFRIFGSSEESENPILSRQTFLDVLFGKAGTNGKSEATKSYGEPLTFEEAYTYLRVLLPQEKNEREMPLKRLSRSDFHFLSENISYENFATDIMGIELPKERRADEDFS